MRWICLCLGVPEKETKSGSDHNYAIKSQCPADWEYFCKNFHFVDSFLTNSSLVSAFNNVDSGIKYNTEMLLIVNYVPPVNPASSTYFAYIKERASDILQSFPPSCCLVIFYDKAVDDSNLC